MIKFKIDPNKLAVIEERYTKAIKDVIANKEMQNEVGAFAVERLKYQARIGKPFNASNSFPPLKSSTKQTRRYLSKYNTTHETFEASRSNLTLTGQLLDSLKYFVGGASGVISIMFTGVRSRYNSANGPFGRALKNEVVGEYLRDKGFLAFDSSIKQNETFKKRIKSIVQAYVRRAMRVRDRLSN